MPKKKNYIALKIIDSEISLIVAFAEKGVGIVSTFMILQDKCFSQYVLLNDQILLFDWLYFLRHWAICV